MECRKLAVGILAGGKSSRMGVNKAFLRLEDQSFLQRILSAGGDFRERLISVEDESSYLEVKEKYEDVTLVEDILKGYGPMEGIYRIISAMRCEACLILATDMPLLSEEFLKDFAGRYEEDMDCLVLTLEGRPQPLCTIYHRRCLPLLEELRREQIHKPRMVFDRVRTVYAAMEEMGYDPRVIRNVNTPGEYEELMGR